MIADATVKLTSIVLMTTVFLSGECIVALGLESNQSRISVLSSGTIGGNTEWFRTSGKWFVNSRGQVIILNGVDFHGNEVGAFGDHTEEDYRNIRSYGFNVVRLPIAWSFV